ncbi:MAG TPA: carbon-nitrogen hydrolase family protein [Bryobacteraceae bacterium]|nr:carbon-nitrogen hydrolase family protein [Bryobacteraceae bacterium]
MCAIRLLAVMAISSALAAGDGSFTVAGLRLMPKRWDKQANFEKLSYYARKAAERGAEVVVTPEGFLEGYVGNEKANKDLTRDRYFAIGEPVDGEMIGRCRNLAKELGIYLVLGFAERSGDQMRNSAAVISPGGEIVLKYSKSHTADDEPFNTKGREFPVTDTPFGRWGTLICMDRQLPETSRILAVKGAQIILVPAWGMNNETNDIMMRTRAYENGVWVVFVHPERVLVIDPSGKITAEDSREGDEAVLAEIRVDSRIGRGPIRHRRPEIYGEILGQAK